MIAASSSKSWATASWVLQILMGGLFLVAGASKIFSAAEMVDFFNQVGFGQWLRYFIGVLEVGSSVALFLPRQAFYGAVVLALALVGHLVIHGVVLHRPASFLWLLLAVAVLIAYLRRPSANRAMAAR
jgi:putative oxidoreductase